MIVSKNLIWKCFKEGSRYQPNLSELESYFFDSGIEIEKYEEIIAPTGLFYGEIEKCELIENCKKDISKCSVFIPEKERFFQIVCGAKNVRTGMKVVVALEGSRLYNSEKVISNKTVYGIYSEGMICGYYELYKSSILTNNDDNAEIIEMPDDWDIRKKFELEDLELNDTIFSLVIPSHRKDLHTAWGLASELLKYIPLSLDLEIGKISFFKMRWILQNNNFFIPKNDEELWQLWIYSLFGHLFQFESTSLKIEFKKNLKIYKNNLNEKYDNFFMRNLIISSTNNRFFNKQLVLKEPDLSEQKVYEVVWNELFDFFSVDQSSRTSCKDQIIKAFSNAGFRFLGDDKNQILFPFWRSNFEKNKDFKFEVATFLTLDKDLVRKEFLSIPSSLEKKNQKILALQKIRFFWINRNFFECNTFNLQEKKIWERTNIFKLEKLITIKDPSSEHHQTFRTHALNELKKVIEDNYKYKNKLHPVFEIFETNNFNKTGRREERYYTLNLVVPQLENISWIDKVISSYDLYDLQSLISRSFSFFNKSLFFKSLDISPVTLFYDTNLLEIFDASSGNSIGFLGILKSHLPFNLYGAVLQLPNSFDENILKKKEYSRFPPAYKDISIDITNSRHNIEEIRDLLLKKAKTRFLKKLSLIDIYSDENLSSITFSIKFQSHDKTLVAKDIDSDISILHKILEEHGLKVR